MRIFHSYVIVHYSPPRRAMISGPDGTPYASGLFTFDILCPADYPHVAPKV